MKVTPLTRFSLGLFAGIGGVFAGLAAVYAAVSLLWPASLPAPALSPMVHLDEKLRFLRDRPELDPHILAVGSSVTWRQLAGGAFAALAGGPHRFVNAATAALQISQTRRLTEFYLDNYPSVRTVLVLTSLPDFEGCKDEAAGRLIDPADARAYTFGGWPAAYFYLRYFSPQRYAKAVLTLSGRRTPLTGDLYFDDYGSGPVKLPEGVDLGLRYKAIAPDPTCVEALNGFLGAMSERGVRTVLVFAPIHPEYRRAYPDVTRQLGEVAKGLKEGLPPRVQVLLLYDDTGFDGDDFYDAFHLEQPAAERLSALIARAMRHEGPPAVLTGDMIRALGDRPAVAVQPRDSHARPFRLVPASATRAMLRM